MVKSDYTPVEQNQYKKHDRDQWRLLNPAKKIYVRK